MRFERIYSAMKNKRILCLFLALLLLSALALPAAAADYTRSY